MAAPSETALATTQGGGISPSVNWSREQLNLLKRTVASGTTDDQFALFVEVARSVGLNPFQRQIYAVVRNSWNPATKKKEPTMTVQTGIDGFRLVAARTNAHIGTEEAEYGPDTTTGKLTHPTTARVAVRRLVAGHVAIFTATARWSEYVQKTFEGEITSFWIRMPYLMLAKCAEALALRKAFPAELSGIYTREEMGQADNDVTPPAPLEPLRKATPPATSAKSAPPPAAKTRTTSDPRTTPSDYDGDPNKIDDRVIDAEVLDDAIDAQVSGRKGAPEVPPPYETPQPRPRTTKAKEETKAPEGEADILQSFVSRIEKAKSIEALDLVAVDMRAVYGSKSPRAVVAAYRLREQQLDA